MQTTDRHIRGKLKLSEMLLSKRIGVNPFGSLQVSTITCLKCGPRDALHRWEVAYDLSVEVMPTIAQSLNAYFQGEFIDDYDCIKCTAKNYLR